MVWIWSSSKENFIREYVDKQIKKLYKALLKKFDKKLKEAVEYDLHDAIRIEVKRQLEAQAVSSADTPIEDDFRADVENVIMEIGHVVTGHTKSLEDLSKKIEDITNPDIPDQSFLKNMTTLGDLNEFMGKNPNAIREIQEQARLAKIRRFVKSGLGGLI